MGVNSTLWLACAVTALLCALPVRAQGKTPAETAAASETAQRSDLRRAAERGATCSQTNAVAAGLQAEYFAAEDFKGALLLRRLEGPIDEAPPAASQRAGTNRTVKSVRWRGWVKIPVAGRYAFHIEPAMASLRVAGSQLAGAGARQASLELAAGRYYPLLIELPKLDAATAKAPVRLSWTAPHGARYVIPRALLFPPSESIADGR